MKEENGSENIPLFNLERGSFDANFFHIQILVLTALSIVLGSLMISLKLPIVRNVVCEKIAGIDKKIEEVQKTVSDMINDPEYFKDFFEGL